jgi:hypothetical protein
MPSALRTTRDTTNVVRGRPPRNMFAPLTEQLAHFPRWIRSMDGVSVPFVWLSGYQIT